MLDGILEEQIDGLKTKEGRIKFIKELLCIAFGTIVGLATYVFCLYHNLAILGWNIGLAIAPLFAGYAEIQLARIIVKESTGAVSAFILFIITVIYGFIISNPTLGFNIITAGSIVIIIQAAIPTATNYFLIIMGLSIISHFSGIFKKLQNFVFDLYRKLFKKEPKRAQITYEQELNKVHDFYDEELEMNNLGILIMTLEYPPKELKIIEQKGMYEARHIFGSNQREEIKKGLEDSLEKELLYSVKLARDKALLKLIKEVKKDGCNGILNLHTSYETLGASKGENIAQVVMRGTGVIFENEEETKEEK